MDEKKYIEAENLLEKLKYSTHNKLTRISTNEEYFKSYEDYDVKDILINMCKRQGLKICYHNDTLFLKALPGSKYATSITEINNEFSKNGSIERYSMYFIIIAFITEIYDGPNMEAVKSFVKLSQLRDKINDVYLNKKQINDKDITSENTNNSTNDTNEEKYNIKQISDFWNHNLTTENIDTSKTQMGFLLRCFKYAEKKGLVSVDKNNDDISMTIIRPLDKLDMHVQTNDFSEALLKITKLTEKEENKNGNI